MDMSAVKEYRDKIVSQCGQVILGKDEVIERVLISFLCRGHVLLEDLPGTGKTMLLRSFSRSIGGSFKRIQFTPDLMPSDLTGIHFFSQKTSEFEFRPGPLFSDVVLADEINRATPRTQAALLESMEEHQITVDGDTYPLSDSFMVMATQNPLENFGTFPLPEAQTDRFFMRLSLGYMDRAQELMVLGRKASVDIINELSAVVTEEETKKVREMIDEVHVSGTVKSYLMDIIELTRNDPSFKNGVSTRGAIALYKASQAKAAFCGRDFVLPEDVKELSVPVLAHRLGQGEKDSLERYLSEKIGTLEVPVENN